MRVLTNLSRRGPLARVGVLLCGFGLAVGLAYVLFAPGDRKAGGGQYKFLYCAECGFERPYDAQLADTRCTLCKPPKVGYLRPAVESVRKGGRPPWPWNRFVIAVGIKVVALLGGLVYVLGRRPAAEAEKEAYASWACPHCKRRLKFRLSSAGKAGQCPRCKRFFKFPDAVGQEDQAVGS